MKRLVAYSSVSHMGFIMLGLYAFNSTGVTGGVLQMVNHGLSTGALFILVGLIYDRTHTREISQYGGIWGSVPVWSAFFLVVTLSSIGLPGLNGFVGEFLILSGAFRAHPVAGMVGTLGVVLGAVYMLTMYQRVAFGPLTHESNRSLPDLNRTRDRRGDRPGRLHRLDRRLSAAVHRAHRAHGRRAARAHGEGGRDPVPGDADPRGGGHPGARRLTPGTPRT